MSTMRRIFGTFGKKARRILLLFMCFAFFAEFAQANQPPYISLQSALLFALYESTDIKIASEKIKQATYSAKEAEAAYYPHLQFLAEIGPEYNNPATFEDRVLLEDKSDVTNSYDISLTLRQMLFDRTKTREIARRNQLVASKSIEKNLTAQDVIENTLTAYIDVLETQKRAYSAAEMLVGVKENVNKITNAFEAGGESRAQLDYAKARLSLAESKYNSALSSYQDAVNRIEALTGPLPDFLAIEPQDLAIQDYDLEFYKHLARKRNDELRLILSNIQASEIDVETQKASYLPKINLVVEAGESFDRGGDVGRYRDASAMIQVQYDIFKGFSRKASKNRALSKVAELKYEKEKLIKDISTDVKKSYSEIEALQSTLTSKASEVESYISLKKIARDSSQEGEVDPFRAIENEEQLFRARKEMYEAQSAIYDKSYALLKLIGSLKKDKFCESCL